jgi:hypothetical protein
MTRDDVGRRLRQRALRLTVASKRGHQGSVLRVGLDNALLFRRRIEAVQKPDLR